MTKRIVDQLKIGPFVTPERQSEWNTSLNVDLEQFIQEDVISQLTVIDWEVEGSFSTRFDDPKFHGPLSAVKHRYRLDIRFVSPEGVEKLGCDLDYDPKNRNFRQPLNPRCVETIPMQRERDQNSKKIDEAIRCHLEGSEDVPCPFCNRSLVFHYMGTKMKDVRCPENCFHVHMDYAHHKNP